MLDLDAQETSQMVRPVSQESRVGVELRRVRAVSVWLSREACHCVPSPGGSTGGGEVPGVRSGASVVRDTGGTGVTVVTGRPLCVKVAWESAR